MGSFAAGVKIRSGGAASDIRPKHTTSAAAPSRYAPLSLQAVRHICSCCVLYHVMNVLIEHH